tara:strand:+ start:767 stop:1585 length:819 start_codon:yes stop_codon:yes gene_type:complete
MSEIRVRNTGTIKLFESDNTSHVTIASPASLSANRTITIPDADVTLGAGTTINNNADNRVITGSGTANTLEGEANLTFNGSQLTLPTGSAGSPSLAHAGDTDTGIYFATNNVVFATAGNNRVELLADGNLSIRQESLKFEGSGKGVYLGTTSGAAANLLNDYEEGTWTPSWSAGGGSLTGTSSNYGKYTKIGDMVSLWFGAVIDSGTASSYYRITNAPFTSTTNGSGTAINGETANIQKAWWDSGGTTININRYDGTLESDPNLKVNIIMKV